MVIHWTSSGICICLRISAVHVCQSAVASDIVGARSGKGPSQNQSLTKHSLLRCRNLSEVILPFKNSLKIDQQNPTEKMYTNQYNGTHDAVCNNRRALICKSAKSKCQCTGVTSNFGKVSAYFCTASGTAAYMYSMWFGLTQTTKMSRSVRHPPQNLSQRPIWYRTMVNVTRLHFNSKFEQLWSPAIKKTRGSCDPVLCLSRQMGDVGKIIVVR